MSRFRRLFPARPICSAALLVALGVASAPLQAERAQTYWRLEPVSGAGIGSAERGQVFLEQRLLPIRLVRLTEAVTVGTRALPAGTFLYLVFNDDGRIGYCTLKDRSAGNQLRTLFIPILDRRPCLADRDNDGRFESSFSVFDKWGGPPSVRGSIDAAQPLGSNAAFEEVDVRQFPVDMRMTFAFSGSASNPSRARIRIGFTDPIGGVWQETAGAPSADGTMFQVGNVAVHLTSLTEGRAVFRVEALGEAYISSNNRNDLSFHTLPAFLVRD